MARTHEENHDLYVANLGAVYFAANQTCPHSEDLDDWTGGLCLLIWRKIALYDPTRGRFTTWVMVVARNYRAGWAEQFRWAGRDTVGKIGTIHRGKNDRIEGSLAVDAIDPRAVSADDIALRLDMEDTVRSLPASKRRIARMVMGDENGADLARSRGVTRQRVCNERYELLQRLRARLTEYAPNRQGGTA